MRHRYLDGADGHLDLVPDTEFYDDLPLVHVIADDELEQLADRFVDTYRSDRTGRSLAELFTEHLRNHTTRPAETALQQPAD